MQRVALAVAMVMTLGSGYLAGVAASAALAAPVRPAERATVAPAADPSGKVYRGGILPAITVVVRPLPFSAASGGTACRQTRIT
ncbi:MAG: hypothetical protein DMD37_11730 [Gemmatimonadetes bacterium]|nr:MAG: hypothetical protein AUJ00_03685 [Gemmatimonadetes bacterium 13_1_40CM_3_70_6]OLD42492.1 MAG: hypothetical protein AUI55_06715 [Gemmatimonadetes bacterium 13_1_40CM_2_70_7]PYO64840.1 MAG: hypothetical protein DMD71_12345 [Gemmatimonadota bacterium]PYO83311.1 MAG: hypothetical protein DMD68_09695 [Gemmatimonadota bacterium]PYP61995.1 MAG: hypothetical protein DMD37_11730 [Gemmatimonadota bacterium]